MKFAQNRMVLKRINWERALFGSAVAGASGLEIGDVAIRPQRPGPRDVPHVGC